MGHNEKCGVNCKHLLRAYALKYKFQGELYPVSKINYDELKYNEFTSSTSLSFS